MIQYEASFAFFFFFLKEKLKTLRNRFSRSLAKRALSVLSPKKNIMNLRISGTFSLPTTTRKQRQWEYELSCET